MIDSTNPRIMANNIRRLASAGGGAIVEANPEDTATRTLEKLKVGDDVYAIPKPLIYSTTEQIAGKWIDNSDLYSKTYIIDSNITNNSTTVIDANITPAMFKGASGYIECDSGAEIWPMLFYLDSNNFVRYLISSSGVSVEIKDGYHSPNKIVITLIYTKTASEAKKSKSKK